GAAGPAPDPLASIVWGLRVPRVAMGTVVGAALATGGVALQGMFRNPLADPYLLGVSSGAAVGAATAIVAGLGGLLGIGAVPAFAFLGGLGTVWVVWQLARAGGRGSVTSLLLAGVAVSAVLSALLSFILLLSGQMLHGIVVWLMGNLSGRSWSQVAWVGGYAAVAYAAIWRYRRELNALTLGEEGALTLGVQVKAVKRNLLAAASLAAAAAVAMTGVIGFVGLMVPHLLRLLVGPDHARLLPTSALGGACLLVLSDTLARCLLPPWEIPVGVITALVGGPFFLYLLWRHQSSGWEVGK
ncbi:MAG TPA: iron chelate uptake ABC transporter family permease subunit, partial [Firmicutes bacterium]|nr:iron chelate uptake ABC transporter family permease subunit [Bacillota bacterium]